MRTQVQGQRGEEQGLLDLDPSLSESTDSVPQAPTSVGGGRSRHFSCREPSTVLP